MSYDEPKAKKKRRPPEDPVALELARKKTLAEKADVLCQAMSMGRAGQRRQLAKMFGKRVKAFKKVLRRAQRIKR